MVNFPALDYSSAGVFNYQHFYPKFNLFLQ